MGIWINYLGIDILDDMNAVERQIEQYSFHEALPHLAGSLLPPEKKLKVSYVVPIKGEVVNGNFFKQLYYFSGQQNIDMSNF